MRVTKASLMEELEVLKARNAELEMKNAELEEVNRQLISKEYWNNQATHNERGAGRKPVISQETKHKARQYRNEGKTYREISQLLEISIGQAHNFCK